jgi:hypothetical protein
MFSILKKLFKSQRKEYYSLDQEPDFSKSLEFSKPDDRIVEKLGLYLYDLKKKDVELLIELPLKNKPLYEFLNVQELAEKMASDLKLNYEEYRREFLDEPLQFVYFLGHEMLFRNSVEIVHKISRNDSSMGNLYYGLVVKYSNGKFYYWPW